MYTKDNIIGLRVDHKDGMNGYEIIAFTDGVIGTRHLHSGYISERWYSMGTLQEVNNWIETGIWIVREDGANNGINYQIY